MSIRTAALTLTVLAFGLTGQCRELRAEAPAEAEEPCTPSWSATLDATLANTISSSKPLQSCTSAARKNTDCYVSFVLQG